jgi:glyoxylase-like metal-dependent hydrolase (beta-lactamase superfamily II)
MGPPRRLPGRTVMEVRLVADRIYLISHAHVNCYVIEDDDGLLLVDAGLPSMRPPLIGLLAGLGKNVTDIRALEDLLRLG